MTQREFIKLYAELKPEIMKSGRLHGLPDAEDILQTTMLELCNGGGYAGVAATKAETWKFLFSAIKLRVTRAKSEQYAARIVHHDAIHVDDLEERAHPTANPYPALDIKADVHKAIDALPESVGVAVRLVYLDGHTLEEAAKSLGVPMRTLQTRINRALPLLREALAAYKSAE